MYASLRSLKSRQKTQQPESAAAYAVFLSYGHENEVILFSIGLNRLYILP